MDIHEPFSHAANSAGMPLLSILDDAVRRAGAAARVAFAARRARLAEWCRILPGGPPSYYSGQVDAPPPLPTAENNALPALVIERGLLAPRCDSTIGTVWSQSLESLSMMSEKSLGEALAAIGDHIASGFEEAAVEALEAATFATAQRTTNTLTAANLSAALAKIDALRTPKGGRGPAPALLLMSTDVLPAFASIFPHGIPGLGVFTSQFAVSGRWFILPEPEPRAPLAIIAGDLVFDPKPSVGPSMTYSANIYALAADPVLRLAADGSPAWAIKGGT